MAKEITEAMQNEWLSDDSLFDEDDLDGATVQCLYCISFNEDGFNLASPIEG
ncbi:hypothetical protein ACX15B_27835 (plasmid) [Vibrio harveyi]